MVANPGCVTAQFFVLGRRATAGAGLSSSRTHALTAPLHSIHTVKMRDASEKPFFIYAAMVILAVGSLSLLYPSVAHTMEYGHEKMRMALLVVLASVVAVRLSGLVIGLAITVVLSVGAIAVSVVTGFARYDVDLVFDLLTLLLVATGIAAYTGLLVQRLRRARAEEVQYTRVLDMGVNLVPRELDAGALTRLLAAVEDASKAECVVLYKLSEGEIVPTPQERGGDVTLLASAEKVARMVFQSYRKPSNGDEAPATDLPEPIVTSGREAFIPVFTPAGIEGVLFAHRDRVMGRWAERELKFLSFCGNLIGALIERQHLQERASRLEAMEEADRLKSTILASVSHDLKTPIAAATATLSSVLHGVGSGRVDSAVADDVASTLEDLAALDVRVTELVDISRLETASWKSNIDYNDVGDLCHLVTGSLKEEVRRRVICPSLAAVPPFRFDLVQIGRALFHIVENALRYSPPDSPVILGVDFDEEHVRISVTDTGPGLSAEDKERVFEKFYRGAASGAVSHGSGLGLSIAERIVGIHGGRIEVDDVEPVGARFTIVLPRIEEVE